MFDVTEISETNTHDTSVSLFRMGLCWLYYIYIWNGTSMEMHLSHVMEPKTKDVWKPSTSLELDYSHA
jgi:hypothetical protein